MRKKFSGVCLEDKDYNTIVVDRGPVRHRFWVLAWLLYLGFFGAYPCLAAPAYGTRLPKKFHLAIGGQTHTVFDRDLEGNDGQLNSLQHFLLLSFGVTDRLSLDLKGGAGDIEQRPGSGGEIKYPAFVGGGYGFRLRVYTHEKTRAVFGFQHISIHPYSVFVNGVKNKAVLDDWQFSFLGSYDLPYWTMYLGGKWSRMDYIHWREDTRKREKSDLDKSVGVITGMDIPLGSQMWVNVEGQFVDVQAITVSLNYEF